LSPLHDDLKQNRRLVVVVAVASGIIGLLPIPLLPDLTISALRSALFKGLARRRRIKLSFSAARIAVDGKRGASMRRLAATTAAIAGLRSWRLLTRSLLLFFRFEDMSKTFLRGFYFDYYLLRFHQGEGVNKQQARMIHDASAEACSSAHLEVITALFRRALSDMARAGIYIPRRLLSMAVSLIRGGEEEVEQIQEIGLLSQAARLVEAELDAAGRVTIEALCRGFDQAWTGAGGEE